MLVTRCVCSGDTFVRLKAVARDEGLSFDELRARTGCASGCGLCEPYIRLMLQTGRTRFPPATEGELAAMLAHAERSDASGHDGKPNAGRARA